MNFLKDIFNYADNNEVVGLTEELNVFYILNYFNNNNKSILIVLNNLYNANKYFDKIATYTDKVAILPMDDFITSVALAVSPDLKLKRLETLERIKNEDKIIVITNLVGYLHFWPSVNFNNKLKLKTGDNIEREKFLKDLEDFGYNHTSLVTTTGEYATRGYIIDIFIVNQEHPLRIEFFGNEIEEIRSFDESTQMSLDKFKDAIIYPNKEVDTESKSTIVDYLNNPKIFMIDCSSINQEYDKLQLTIKEYLESKDEIQKKLMYDFDDLNYKNISYLDLIKTLDKKSNTYNSKAIDNFNSNFELLKEFINKKIKDNKTVILCMSNNKEIDKLKEFCVNAIITDANNIKDNKINIIKEKINNGFEISDYVVISEYDIEVNKHINKIKYKNNLKVGHKINSYNDLTIGDYVVHYAHGIGIYGGVVTLNQNNFKKDYLLVNYAGNDKLYVSVDKINNIYKYTNKEGVAPTLNKLNSMNWHKTKSAIKKKIHDISQELIRLYAKRASIKGPVFLDSSLDDLFKQDFPYVLTDDQSKANNEILSDLESPIPMDRLLCGDVGFGKTEVAFRAMFRTVINGYQVAYLCPTTILSNQQYHLALERFKNFPVTIKLLNRFTTAKEVKEIIDGLKKGVVDIVFGTHRLLSGDIKYSKLGLLVIDEEQRFGVTHKEKIKEIKQDINVLVMSATPIPRTMKMALTGLRNLSIIDTPPVNRYPVETYVLSQNDIVIKDAIYKELSRHGQIYILYNNVSNMDEEVQSIRTLVPEARIVSAHGQMTKLELENIMADFVNYEYDILVCSTIIETGIDIPNVNTLIVIDADRFGLSQLYQLRGRVGRSNRIAYAYLMYNEHKMLNDIAIKRLKAISEFTELGSGYRIAMRDLALRGAGDILGSEQAGFVSSVGLDLYMKMVDDEVKRINGIPLYEEDDSNTSFVDVNTHIDDSYITDENIKIEIHKKINDINSYDSLVAVKQELEDRFGKINEDLDIYMHEEWLEKLAYKLGITKYSQNDKEIILNIPHTTVDKIKFDKIFIQAYKICSKFTFKTIGHNVLISLNLINLEKNYVYYLVALLNLMVEEVDKK